MQLPVEFLGGAADLHGGDVEAAEPFEHGGDLACRDTPDVHLGDGKGEGAFAADAALQGLGVERIALLVVVVAGLWDLQRNPADAGGERLGLEPVGVAAAFGGALVGGGAEDLLTLDAMAWLSSVANAEAMASGPCSMSSSMSWSKAVESGCQGVPGAGALWVILGVP